MNRRASGPQLAVPMLLAAALLSGCAGYAPMARETLATFDQPVQLAQVAFYPQTEFHCGPAALATVLDHSGVAVDYASLVDQVYLPGRGGTLQVELLAAARSHDRIPWVLPPEPAAVLAEVAAGRPVLVLENQGLRRLPYWHYAVVTGFDPDTGSIVQHSGTEAETARPMRRWLRDWNLAGRWALLTLPPDELPLTPDPDRWFSTVADFEAVAEAQAVLIAWQTAADRWPQEAIPRLGLGNVHYRLGDPQAAITAFEEALTLNPDLAAASFNIGQLQLQGEQYCTATATFIGLVDHPAFGERARAAHADAVRACSSAP